MATRGGGRSGSGGGRSGGGGSAGGRAGGSSRGGVARSGGPARSGSGRSGGASGGRAGGPSGTGRSGGARGSSGRPSGAGSGGGAGAGRSAGSARGAAPLRSPRATGGAPRSGAGAPGWGDQPDFRTREPKGLDGTQVEGRVAVRELLAAGRRRVRTLLMAEGTDDSPILEEIEALAREVGVPIRWMPKEMVLANARSEAPQGVIARCDELDEADVDDLLEPGPPGGPQPFVLALDGVTDPGNFGALLRSAQGAGVTGVVVPRHRAVHVTPSAAKAAAGAIEHLPIAVVGGLPATLLRAKERGVWVVGLDAGGDHTIYDLAHLADQPLIVVVGAEGDGLSRLTRDRCDAVASIPVRGGLESLNASVAGAIALFEFGRHRPQ